MKPVLGPRSRWPLAGLAVLALVGFARLGGPPSAADAAVPAAQGSGAAAFLAAARGTDPTLCALAARTVRQRWGGDGRGVLEDLSGMGSAERALTDWVLTEDPGPADVPPLRRGMSDPDPCTRQLAALLLARSASRPGPAMDALLAGLAAADAGTRRVAALGLGAAGSRDAVGPLLEVLGDDTAPVRATAAWALGALEDASAVPALLDRLLDDDARVRRTAAYALGEIEDPRAGPSLTRVLSSDDDAGVRRAAAWALGSLY